VNYYSFHIGDFRSGTINMSRQARWMYRDMLDIYYDTEKPLKLDFELLCDEIGAESDEDRRLVERILRLKFVKTEDGYHNEVCDQVIAEYHKKAETAQTNGKLGGRPKKAKANPEKPSGLSVGSNPVADSIHQPTGSQTNQEPITNKEEPPIPPKGGEEARQDESPKRKAAISLRTYLDDCKQVGQKAIPEGHAVFAYAEKVGIPDTFLRLHWLEFKDRYTMPDAKRYKSWPTVFHKSVKGNWFRLWRAANDGSYVLTTEGQQAQRDHGEAA
jgi:uncharacterized protein YdaU (DUF1376 family)